MDLSLITNNVLRSAIRRNLVSFPSQIPALTKTGSVRDRIVQLYFVRGWDLPAICDRYGLDKSTVRKCISDWKVRAVAAGLIQEIHTGALAALVGDRDPCDVTTEPDWTALPGQSALASPELVFLIPDTASAP